MTLHPNTVDRSPSFRKHALVYTWMGDNRRVWKGLGDYDAEWNDLARQAKADGFYAPATTIVQITTALKRIAEAQRDLT